MAGYDGTVRINTKLNTDAFQAGISGMVKNVKGLVKTLGVGLSIAGLAKFGKECIGIASDLAEVQNVVDVSFGKMSYKMEEFAKTSIETFGMSKLSAKQMGSTFVAMARGMGQGLDEATDMALEMTGRMGDIASFYNKSLQEVNTIGRAVYSGETEPLKQIGVIMTEAQLQTYAMANGYKKLYKEMSASEKLLVRQQYFLEATKLSAGDFVRTQDSWANQTKILSEQWKEFMSILGSGLITVLTPVVKMLNTLVASLISVGNTISNIMTKVFGVNMQNVADEASKASQNYEDLADSTDDYTDATKKATKANKNATASFDSLEVLTKPSAGSGAVDSEVIDATAIQENTEDAEDVLTAFEQKLYDFKEKVQDYIKELYALFNAGFDMGSFKLDLDSQFDDIVNSVLSIKDNLMGIFTDSEVTGALDSFIKKFTFNLGLVASSVISIGTTIAQNLLGGISKYLEDNSNTIKDFLVTMFDIGTEISEMAGQFSEAFAEIFSVFGGENGQELTANIIGIFADAFMGVNEICAKFGRDVLGIIATPIIENKDQLKSALDDVLGVFAKISNTIKDTIDKTFKSLNDTYDKYFKPFFDSIGKGVSDIVGFILDLWEQTLSPTLDQFANKFDKLMHDLQPYIDNIIDFIGVIAQLVQEVWEDVLVPVIQWLADVMMRNFKMVVDYIANKIFPIIKDTAQIISGVVSVIKGILKMLIGFLKGVFKGEWEEAWNMIKDGFSDVWDGIKNFLLGTINKIIDMLNALLQAVVDRLLNTIVNKVNAVIDKLPFGVAESWEVPTITAPTIPHLANGAVIKGGSPFLAVLGDQKAGQTNIETPLDTMIQAFKSALSDMGVNNRGTQPINLNIDGETLARLTLEDFMLEAQRQGYELNLGV